MSGTLANGRQKASDAARGAGGVVQGFKDFIARGNAIDLAVAVVLGAAFGAVIGAINEGFISPLIAAIFGEPDLSGVLAFTINDAEFSIGLILNALLYFLMTAAAVYFFIVVPLNRLAARRKAGEEAEPAAPSEEILLLTEIRDLLAQRPASSGPAHTDETRPPV